MSCEFPGSVRWSWNGEQGLEVENLCDPLERHEEGKGDSSRCSAAEQGLDLEEERER